MDDLISRQAAIDAIGKKSDAIYMTKQKGATYPHDDFFQGMAYAENIIKSLPSAQPEQPMICGECKHYKQDSQGILYCYKHRGYGWDWDDFCSYAERKEL